MTQHTPGPWCVEQGTTLVWGDCTLNDDGSPDRLGVPVADAQLARPWAGGEPSHRTAEANACVIAAAPDMLTVLQRIRDSYPGYIPDFIEAVNAVIDKATPTLSSPVTGGRND